MSARLEPVLSFDRSSPVRDYWLAHCEGFRLETQRGEHGVVEAIAASDPDGHADVLAVRIGRRGRLRLLEADEVDEVVPADRLLLVGAERPDLRSPDGRPPRSERVLEALTDGTERAARSAQAGLSRGGRALAAGSSSTLGLLSRALLGLGRTARRALAAAYAAAGPATVAYARGLRRDSVALVHWSALVAEAASKRSRAAAARFRAFAGPRARRTWAIVRSGLRTLDARGHEVALDVHRRLAARSAERRTTPRRPRTTDASTRRRDPRGRTRSSRRPR